MGEQSRKLKAFIQEHPICCFCGKEQTETYDHLPPQAAFILRHNPKGYKFPACMTCNNGASKDDQVFSFLSLAFGRPDGHIPDRDVKRLLRGMQNNMPQPFKGEFEKFIINGYEAFELSNNTRSAITRTARKIAKALHYKKNKNVLKRSAIIAIVPISNLNFEDGATKELLSFFQDLHVPEIDKHISGEYGRQFAFVYKDIVDTDAYSIRFNIHSAFEFVCIVSEKGRKIASGVPLPWYDMNEEIVI